MPKITNQKVLQVLRDPYFDHHTVMHLGRERIEFPDGHKEKLILDPSIMCKDCDQMIEAGLPGSGTEFLHMHHEMIRVFNFLLDKAGIEFGVNWDAGEGRYKPIHNSASRRARYAPPLWDLDDYNLMPYEIRGMFSVTDPHYLRDAFDGVKERVHRHGDCKKLHEPNGAADHLGRYIERGVEQGETVHGEGIHNTLHDYLGSREGKSAAGAEMNKLRNSMFNDYFWSLHLWIDGHHGRLHQRCKDEFETGPLNPAKASKSMKGAHAHA